LQINVSQSVLSTFDIIVDVRDIVSIVALGNDNMGDANRDDNVLSINKYFCLASNKWIETPRALSLPGDAYRDRTFIDWII